MKAKVLFLICTLVLFAGAVKAQTTDAAKAVSWQSYTVKGEMFSVALPLLPAMHVNDIWFKGERTTRREVQLGSYADGLAYTVYVLENPRPQQSLQEFIAERIGRGSTHLGGSDVSRDGVVGKVFVSASPGDTVIQFFSTKDRLYEFRASGASPEDPRMTSFFSSVSFGKPKDAVAVEEGPGLPFEQPIQSGSAEEELAKKRFLGKEVDRKPRLVMKPEPSYTEAARQNAISGTVVLKCIFKYDGTVKNIITVSGLPYGLTERAIQAASRLKFIPAMKDGKYVSMWMQLEYNFNLY